MAIRDVVAMLFLTMLLAGGAMAGAKPIQPEYWVTDEDYPWESRIHGEEGTTKFRLVITPTGKSDRCDILISSESKLLDLQTCALMMARGNFHPARDEQRKPTYAVIERRVHWLLNSKASDTPKPDFEILLNTLPKKISRPPMLNIHLMIDETGVLRSCISDRMKAAPSLETIACQQALAEWAAKPAINHDGNAVPSVQTIKVRFSTEYLSNAK